MSLPFGRNRSDALHSENESSELTTVSEVLDRSEQHADRSTAFRIGSVPMT